jgi:type IV pilus assembly protein PilM
LKVFGISIKNKESKKGETSSKPVKSNENGKGGINGLLRKLAPKKNQFAAVDIGSSEIKLVEISTADGSPVVMASGKLPTPENSLDLADEEVLVNALNELVLTSGMQLREVITTISGDRVVTRHIKLPVMPDKELETAVRFEVEKLVPIPVEDLTIRYVKLGVTGVNGEKTMHILAAAVPTSYIYDLYRVFARADLTVAAIDLQVFSLWRVFCGLNPSNNTGTVGVMDIGAASTQFLVVRDGLLEFTRTLPVGGNLLTQSLAEYYGYELGQASQMKEERGKLLSAEEAAATTEEEMQMDFSLRDGLSELVREIRRSIDYYASQEGATLIEKFVLSGGAVKLAGFREFMAEAMEVPVELGDPGLPGQPVDSTAPELFDQSYAVVLGSALREVFA